MRSFTHLVAQRTLPTAPPTTQGWSRPLGLLRGGGGSTGVPRGRWGRRGWRLEQEPGGEGRAGRGGPHQGVGPWDGHSPVACSQQGPGARGLDCGAARHTDRSCSLGQVTPALRTWPCCPAPPFPSTPPRPQPRLLRHRPCPLGLYPSSENKLRKQVSSLASVCLSCSRCPSGPGFGRPPGPDRRPLRSPYPLCKILEAGSA